MTRTGAHAYLIKIVLSSFAAPDEIEAPEFIPFPRNNNKYFSFLLRRDGVPGGLLLAACCWWWKFCSGCS